MSIERSRQASDGGRPDTGMDRFEDRVEQGLDHLSAAIRPRLRGWLHAGTFPVAVAVGALLTVLSPDARTRLALALFSLSAALLFGISALYHRGAWVGRAEKVLRRFDHANIFLIIAGTYTPFCVLLLPPGHARTLLWIVWAGALAGVGFRVLWIGAPRWLYVSVYIALGWVAVLYLPAFWQAGGAPVVTFLVLGGALYTLGAVVYGFQRPDPSPRWFGFHEVFHALTITAFAAHCIGISIALRTAIA
ncbi:hemolysin III [Actinoplanes octamycinicus]|uniref:Hemolysin III n=1 Tax=Actinoplanes octamycinicus TaxID=135948 RepID=A0A7W7GZU9_9ACTN|nr:hemolysin III family protein [Actinoplanes octamycinicus]MBB4741354.1 hemolysin III [Actinoplanes octamycinicus]GIE62846.1 DNA-binding protein [Actinoplanes octamycinicus]